MRVSAMHRLQRALTAMKLAEMAKLGVERRRAATARAEADTLRSTSRSLYSNHDDAAGLLQQSRWQQSLELRARQADAEAAAADEAAKPLGATLSQTLGREGVTTLLIDQARKEHQRVSERRAEGVPPSKRPLTGPS